MKVQCFADTFRQRTRILASLPKTSQLTAVCKKRYPAEQQPVPDEPFGEGPSMIPTPKLHDIADLSLRCRLQTGMIGLALPLLLVCTSIPSAALAGVCTKSSRTCCAFTEKKARTTVENQSSSMTILAELNRDDSQKWEKYIHPGEKAEFTARFARMSGGRAVLTLQLYPDPGIRSSECKYYVVAGENYLDWRLPDGASEVCPDIGDMKIACDKTFNQSKARYTTTFTIGDPE